MLQSFTVPNINFAFTLYLSLISFDSAFKILFSRQVLGQWSKKQKSYRENMILSGHDLSRDLQFENILNRKWDVRCFILKKACYLDNKRQWKSILQVKVYYTAFFPRDFSLTQSLDRRLSQG